MVEKGLDFYFDMIKWVFTDFLINVKILGISVLYYFLAIILLSVVILGLINSVSAGNLVNYASNTRRRRENSELREHSLNRVRSRK